MADYSKVSEALKNGADPAMLCATCPWDRFCVTPPSMTSAEIQKAMEEASANDTTSAEKARSEGREAPMPMGSLLTAITLGGRDTQAHVCPVLALRLRSSDGERIVRQVKSQMQSWDDNHVGYPGPGAFPQQQSGIHIPDNPHYRGNGSDISRPERQLG